MSYKIAVTGKGGVGKTTITALMINRLINNKKTPILSVDADPNSCLNQVLGVKLKNSVGRVREEARKNTTTGELTGIAKQEFLELKINESLVETESFDLIAMGRPEGPGCYCYANNVLKEIIQKLSIRYPYIVIDNEAGLENLSRRIVQEVNQLIIVADSSKIGIETLTRLYELAREMEIKFDKLSIIINRLRKNIIPDEAYKIKEKIKADFIIGIPDDAEISEFAEKNNNLLNLSVGNNALKIIDGFLNNIIL